MTTSTTTDAQPMTLQAVRRTGKAGRQFREVDTGHVYSYAQLRDGTGFRAGTTFVPVDTTVADVLHDTTTGLDRPGQTYSLQRTYAIPLGSRPAPAWKVRVTVRVDSYGRQSVYRADVWTGTGWVEVDRIDGDDPLMAEVEGRRGDTGIASGYVPAEFAHEKSDSLEWVAGLLLQRALAVVDTREGR